jgi:hypothetical protein
MQVVRSDDKRVKKNDDKLAETAARYACDICGTRLTSCEFITHECVVKS